MPDRPDPGPEPDFLPLLASAWQLLRPVAKLVYTGLLLPLQPPPHRTCKRPVQNPPATAAAAPTPQDPRQLLQPPVHPLPASPRRPPAPELGWPAPEGGGKDMVECMTAAGVGG